jgi:NTP pyrophosphatase (non-canonical NTP hydrolase)
MDGGSPAGEPAPFILPGGSLHLQRTMKILLPNEPRCSPPVSLIVTLRGGNMQLRSAQKLAWENKVAKGFNTTDVPLEFCLLQGEIAEAFDAWRKGREDVGEELADVAIYLLSLAEMTGIDLQDQTEAKMAKNAARVYQRLPNGVLAKRNDDAG